LTREYYGGVSATGHDVEVGGNHLIPLGLLDDDSRQAQWIIDYMEDQWFFIDGIFNSYPVAESEADWFTFGGFSKLQPHYTRTTDIHALRDDVKAFIRSYFNTFPLLLNRENLCYWEHFNNGGAWNKTHESAWFLQMTRTMMITERDDELWLAPFVTRNWFEDGKTLGIRNAPTRFGKMSYTIQSSVNTGHIDAVIDPPDRNAPSIIMLRVRHPQNKPMQSVQVNDESLNTFEPDTDIIRLRPSGNTIQVRVFY
jgi:hypothetical protein